MSRKVRIDIEGGLYHVYNRVAHGLRPFADDEEAARFVDLLRETKDRDGLVVFAWCLLPNHFHLAVRTRSVRLWRSMRSLQHRYALGFNRRSRRRGPVWQGRYKAKLIEDQRYFNQLLAYIHLNPVRAGTVEDPANFSWSGHRELVREQRNPVIDVDDALMGFGSTVRSARVAYVRMLRGLREKPWVGEVVGRLPWWLQRDDREIQPVDTGPYLDIHGRSTGLDRPELNATDYVAAVAEILAVEPEEIGGRKRNPGIVRIRELTAVLGVERYGVPVKGLAEELGKSRVTVSTWVARGAAKRATDSSFENWVDDVDRRLAGHAS